VYSLDAPVAERAPAPDAVAAYYWDPDAARDSKTLSSR